MIRITPVEFRGHEIARLNAGACECPESAGIPRTIAARTGNWVGGEADDWPFLKRSIEKILKAR
jgi:hypothetical protein